jgi:hypothetical protein
MQYTVKSGDTLWDIASKYLGSGSKWRDLGYTGNPRNLQVGTKLTWGTPKKKTSSKTKKSAKTSNRKPSSLVEDYAQLGKEAAPTIPQFQNVLPWQQVEKQWLPGMQATGRQYVLPEVQRELNKDLQEYRMGMASVGGGRFGRSLGGIGGLQAAAERNAKEQVQDYITSQMGALKGLWYDPLREDYNRARDAGDVYGNINVPTWSKMMRKYPSLTGYSSGSNSSSLLKTGAGRSLFNTVT